MRKFLDGFRSSVSQQTRPDQEIVETLRPDNFQVAKVHESTIRAQSLAARDHLQTALETDITASSGQHKIALLDSSGIVDDFIFKLEKGHLQLHSASAKGLTRLGIVNGVDHEGERRDAFNVMEQLGEQLVWAGIPEERPAEIGSQAQAVPNDAYSDMNGLDPYSKVAKRVVKTLENYIQTYAKSFEDLQRKVVGEIFTQDVLERIENCSANEELRFQMSEAEKIITSANLTAIILNNKTLMSDELEREVASLDYQIVSDRISQEMFELKKAASFQLNDAIENYCGKVHMRHSVDTLDSSVSFDPKVRLSQLPFGCRECPCGTLPPEPPTTESTAVTPPPTAECVCPCGTLPPTDPPTGTTVRPIIPGQRASLVHCQCPCGTLPPPDPPTEPTVRLIIPGQRASLVHCQCPCGTLPPSLEPPPPYIEKFTTISPPSTDVSEASSTLCPNCTGEFESSITPCPNCTGEFESSTTPCPNCTGGFESATTPCANCSTVAPLGEVADPHLIIYNRITLFGEAIDEELEEFESTSETETTKDLGAPHTDVPNNLRDLTSLEVIDSASASEINNSHENEFPAWPQFSNNVKKPTATPFLNLWPSLARSRPVFFETETGKGQLFFKVWFKNRQKPSEKTSSEEPPRRKCKHKHKSCSSSSSDESDSKSQCSGKVKHLHRKSPCSADRPCSKSCSSASDSSQCSFSSTESSEECYSCSQECSDEHCSSSDDCSRTGCSDCYEECSTEEDRRR